MTSQKIITSNDIVNSGVSAGSYTATNLTVDAAGRITAASSGSGGASIGGAVTNGTAGSILFVNPSATLAQDNTYLFYDFTNHYLGLNQTTPTARLDTVSRQLATGNPAAGGISFSTGNVTGYAAQGAGTAYTYHVYNSQVINGVTVYSATPAAFSITENIDPVSPIYSLTENVSGYNYGITPSYKIYSIFSDGTRSVGTTIVTNIDATPTSPTATQNPLGSGTGYTASGQTENYTIYPTFSGGQRASTGATTSVTFDSSFSQVQANISWTINTHLTPDGWLIVNTSTNTSTTVSGGTISTIDTADWAGYSDPGVTSALFTINFSWTAAPHGATGYYTESLLNFTAQSSGGTSVSDSNMWSPYSDPGLTQLDFLITWSNGAGATDTLVQSSLKPSNTYDFAGLNTSLSDDSTGWGTFVTTTTSFALDNALLSDGLGIFQNTSGNTTAPLNAYAPSGGHSQNWFDSSNNPQGYVGSNGQFNGVFNGSFNGSLSGSQSGGTINSTGFANSGTFSNSTNNAEAQFVTTGLNGANHEYGNITTYAKTNTASNDFGGGWKMVAQSDSGANEPQAAIFGSWAQAHDSTYNGRLYLGTYSASNSNNFKEFVRMQMETTNSDNVPQTAWGVGTVQFVANNFGTGGQSYTGVRITAQGTPDTDLFQIADSSAVIRAHVDQLYGDWAANQYAADTSSLGSEKITNGTFTGGSTSWTLGTGWTYSSNAVHKSADGTGTLSQTSAAMVTPLVIGQFYQLQYTMSGWTVGTLTPSCGGVTMKTDNGAFTNGNTQTRYFRALSTADLTFTPSNTARFNLDNISLKQITAGDVVAAANLLVGGTTTLATALPVASGGTGSATALGIPLIVGNDRKTGLTAAQALATLTVGASDTSYHISANVLITASTAFSFSVTCTYIDEGNTSRTLTLNFSQISGTLVQTLTNVLGAGAYEGVPLHIRAKAGTTIVIASAGGGTYTTVTYSLEERIMQM